MKKRRRLRRRAKAGRTLRAARNGSAHRADQKGGFTAEKRRVSAEQRSVTRRQLRGEAPEDALVERFVIREVQPHDLEDLYSLSRHLDSVNFPHNREHLSALIARARSSFAGKIEQMNRREYMFVLEGQRSRRIAGTSMIIAQHGHPDAPHIFFDVVQDERFSATLDRHFSHTTLRLGFHYRGPTEIGALVLDPSLRAHGLGKQLSYVRFLFIAMFRERFQRSVIAELMPPLLDDGRSLLWEHLGRHFTSLSYQEADKLSHTNKEFITSLFPQTPLYATLLPAEVQALIGQVGEETKGVKRMLEAIGFRYSERIDPFDGGPHFEAATDEITLVKEARRGIVSETAIDREEERAELTRRRGGEVPASPEQPVRALVGVANDEGPTKFRAVLAAIRRDGKSVRLSAETQRILKVKPGTAVWTVPV
jgi:arginine N-succinyltransferase